MEMLEWVTSAARSSDEMWLSHLLKLRTCSSVLRVNARKIG